MAQRVFIQVIGFSDEERHALNTVFRLSEQCRTSYQLWTPQAPEPAGVALLDAASYEARLAAESPLNHDLPKLWVGPHPPASTWRSFVRPIAWREVIEALDALFAADALDLDLGFEDSVTSQKQALIVAADRERRLYLRARLALAKLTLADEALSGGEALELARDKQYDLALVDGQPGDMDPCTLMRQLRAARHPVTTVAITKRDLSLAQQARARLAGVDALWDASPHPERFDAWLARI